MQRILVAYCSLTGHTRLITDVTAAACAADFEPIATLIGKEPEIKSGDFEGRITSFVTVLDA